MPAPREEPKTETKPAMTHPKVKEKHDDANAATKTTTEKKKKRKKENAFQTNRKYVESRWRVPRAPYEW
jgi:hypothetical protein